MDNKQPDSSLPPSVPGREGTYPQCLPRAGLDVNDLHRAHENLMQWAPDLFVRDEAACHIEIRQHARPNACLPEGKPGRVTDDASDAVYQLPPNQDLGRLSSPEAITNADGLREALQKLLPPGSTQIFLIYRLNSWSRIKVTLDMFQLLCASLRATPRFVDLIRGMRSRISPGDEHFMNCYYSIDDSEHLQGDSPQAIHSPVTDLGYEVCYNIRHYEKHGRDLTDSWSCRQSVVYQRYMFENSQSRWIVIQPPASLEASMDDAKMNHTAHPLADHLRSLSSAIANNWEYLEHTSQQLLFLDMRTAFHKPLSQLNVNFTTSQDVYSIRRKLHRLKTILDGTQRIVVALSRLARSIQKRARVTRSADAAFLRELDSMSRDLDAYKSTARELLDHSADMGTTINYIINFRNQGILASNAAQLHRIAEDNALETKAMAEIGQRTCTDSRTMRIATIIALIYLPANLVLTFFSTVFVDIQSPAGASTGTSNSTGQDGPQLRIYEQIWILFISMITLSVGTGSWFWIWNRTSPLAGVANRASKF